MTSYKKKGFDIVRAAIMEDIGQGDVTSAGSLNVERINAEVVAKSTGVLSGLEIFIEVFSRIDPANELKPIISDGDKFKPGDKIIEMHGFNNTLLMSERVALNFMAHLSGVATMTNHFVEKIKHTNCAILDTRKTMPGMRLLEKQAVLHGGGQNHRMGLYDMVLIKDNHIAAAGSITNAVHNVKEYIGSFDFILQTGMNPTTFKIEVEVTNETQLLEAIEVGVDRCLLDNQTTANLTKLVIAGRKADSSVELEASGNVTLDTVLPIAETGVDFISVGGITHSAPVADFSMRIVS